MSSERVTASADAASRRVFAVTPVGAGALAETRAMGELLWAGVRLQSLVRQS